MKIVFSNFLGCFLLGCKSDQWGGDGDSTTTPAPGPDDPTTPSPGDSKPCDAIRNRADACTKAYCSWVDVTPRDSAPVCSLNCNTNQCNADTAERETDVGTEKMIFSKGCKFEKVGDLEVCVRRAYTYASTCIADSTTEKECQDSALTNSGVGCYFLPFNVSVLDTTVPQTQAVDAAMVAPITPGCYTATFGDDQLSTQCSRFNQNLRDCYAVNTAIEYNDDAAVNGGYTVAGVNTFNMKHGLPAGSSNKCFAFQFAQKLQ